MPRSLFLCLVTASIFCLPTHAQNPPAQPSAKNDAELDAEANQAYNLYQKGKSLEALPLFEELHAARPTRPAYMEGVAVGFVAKAGAANTPEEALTYRKRALQLFLDAKAAGATDDLSQIMIEKLTASLNGPKTGTPPGPLPPGREAFNQAEVLFNKGDLAGSVALYAKSWQENPQYYPAPLFAGDAEYKLGHYDEAGVWFARAIALDPDTETAHRYWADCLMKAGKPAEARKQYIEAFIANPYQKAPRLQLHTYAKNSNLLYAAPPITLPALPNKSTNGNININLNMPADGKVDPLSSVWLMYSMNSALWQGDKFKKQFPNEKEYRHSLAEEVDSIHLLLVGLREQKIKDSQLTPTLRSLLALEKDNMIECWILLDAPDQGTAQDYVAYRATHRDLLRAYIEKYDLHPA